MEIKELDSFGLAEQITDAMAIEFCGHGTFAVMTKSQVQMMCFNSMQIFDEKCINLDMSVVDCPAGSPTNYLTLNLRKMYSLTSANTRHELLLDNVLIPTLTCTKPIIRIVEFSLSPLNVVPHNGSLILVLNNFGEAVIYIRDGRMGGRPVETSRHWTVLKNLTDIWVEYLKEVTSIFNTTVKQFDELKSATNSLVIHTACWKDELHKDHAYIACVLRSQKIIMFRLRAFTTIANVDVQLCYSGGDDLKEIDEIQKMKWITMSESVSLLVSMCADGRIIRHKITFPETSTETPQLERMSELWTDADTIAVSSLHVSRSTESNTVIIVATKLAHVLMFSLELDSSNFQKTHFELYHFDYYMISGITQLSDLSYLMCSPTCTAQVLTLKMEDGMKFSFTVADVKLQINSKEWRVQGVQASRNKCLLMFLTDIALPVDHLRVRQTSNVVVCKSNFVDPYKILTQNQTEPLTNFSDAIEILRETYFQSKEIDENFMESITENIEFSDQYVYRLKLKLIVFGIMAGFYHRNNEKMHIEYSKIYNSLQKLIEVQIAYRNLKILNSLHGSKSFTKNQALSSKSLRVFLNDFLKIDFTEDLKVIKDALRRPLDKLIKSTIYVEHYELDACKYCMKLLLSGDIVCENNHRVERCMFSQVQVPFFQYRSCSNCNRMCANCEDLMDVFYPDVNDLLCIFCDSVLKSE